jgi:hypothetical protein|nr:MAG TPA: hypothetical protein [Caudoviricetes sp.]
MSNKFVEFFMNLFKKADGFREGLENKLADVLDKIDDSEEVDEAEKKLIEGAINYALEYYGVKNVPAGVTEAISEGLVDSLGKLNNKLQTQLRK